MAKLWTKDPQIVEEHRRIVEELQGKGVPKESALRVAAKVAQARATESR